MVPYTLDCNDMRFALPQGFSFQWSGLSLEEIKAELYRLASTSLLEGVEITFDERPLPAPPGPLPRTHR